jgi:L-histidine Nalpha-methyltransferase
VRVGLASTPRSLRAWMFYDHLGSQLFERITELPEYYPTRTERVLLEDQADSIVATACAGSRQLRIIELGAGTASKTGTILSAIARRGIDAIYMPLDVSADALDVACQHVGTTFPRVVLEPLVVNYVKNPPLLEEFDGPTLALYLGSSIGNFLPDEARTILRNLRCQLQVGDALLLGTDLVKDESTLVAAYNDREGITAAFNMNILTRLNNELGADFNLSRFRHRAYWNGAESRIEMHLESTEKSDVQIAAADLELQFIMGKTLAICAQLMDRFRILDWFATKALLKVIESGKCKCQNSCPSMSAFHVRSNGKASLSVLRSGKALSRTGSSLIV